MKKKKSHIIVPEDLASGESGLLLHACCAPCSTAIVEWLLQHDIRPVMYYYNPNIWPRDEYEKRKVESKRHAELNGLKWIDDDWNHNDWLVRMKGMENEPERGRRCEACFLMRLQSAARKAQELGLQWVATTLATSRWKDLNQVNAAGEAAVANVDGVNFWAQNWRKDGLQDRRNALIKEGHFYNQLYCGCEYSYRDTIIKKHEEK